MRGRRANNLLAGFFLIGSLALAVGVSVFLSDISISSKTEYIVSFALEDGAEGVKRGSDVTLGGQTVGRVTQIDFTRENERVVAVEVTIRIREDIALRQDASVELVRPLLGTMSTLNIREPGSAEAAPLESGSMIMGSLADPSFLTGGNTGRTLESVQQAAAKIELLLEALPEDASTRIARILEDVEETTTRISSASEGWAESIDSTLDAVKRFADQLPAIPTDVQRVIGEAETAIEQFASAAEQAELGVGEARGVIGSVQDVVDRNASKVDTFFDGLSAASSSLNEETIPAVNEFVSSLSGPRDEISSAASRLDAFLRDELVQARTVLTNTRLATTQLKLLAAEVRAAPWRLLARPSTRELDTQLLYDSARAYANAVSDLRAAGEALDAAAGERSGSAEIAALQDRVRDAIEAHEQAEQALFDRLLSDAP